MYGILLFYLYSITTARIAGIGTSFIVQETDTSDSSIIFAAACAICTIMVVLLPVETLGRELTDDSDDQLDEMVMNVLTEYDQSTLPLMQHQPMSVIREQMEEAVRLQKSGGDRDGEEETRTALLGLGAASSSSSHSGTSKSAFF